MNKADQLIAEIVYVPLSQNEREERRLRLRSLLHRGATRLLDQQPVITSVTAGSLAAHGQG